MNPITRVEHWDAAWERAPRMRLPRNWPPSNTDRMEMLRGEVRPGMRFLELGCAPGKLLSYVAGRLGAKVSGLDYSPRGIEWAEQLFGALHIAADLRCEDVFQTSFAPGSFDVVYSGGLIEHFDDPLPLIEVHLKLLAPGGTALITAPNFAGIYGRLARWFAPANLALHNMALTSPMGLEAVAGRITEAEVAVEPFGRFSLNTVAFEERVGPLAARLARIAGDAAGLLQPFAVRSVAPHILLKIKTV
jgi:2-polyprenyl-3-methyl-5-hydroxy-6-metoxy-1,4-benzoquinol methylase